MRLLTSAYFHPFHGGATETSSEVGRCFDDAEHEQSDGREEHDQTGCGDPWCPFAFARTLKLVKVSDLLPGCPNVP
jgi:hypothetical protein